MLVYFGNAVKTWYLWLAGSFSKESVKLFIVCADELAEL